MTAVGFVGLGRMGTPMALNVARSCGLAAVWNRDRRKAEHVAASTGAVVCDRPRDVAAACDVVVTMLADDRAATEVHLGPDGLLAEGGRVRHLVQMGTHSPDHVIHLASMARPGIVIDAPVSGSVDAAAAGSLLVLAGADGPALAPVRPVLEAVGAEIVELGRLGWGAAMKLAVNLVIHGLNQSVAEALLFAERLGLTPAATLGVLERSAAGAPMVSYRRPQYLDDRAHPVSFAMDLAAKDLGLVVDLGGRLGLSMPQTQLNHTQQLAACAAGLGQRDMAAIATYLRERS